MSSERRAQLEQRRRVWEERTLQPALARAPERQATFVTTSGLPIERLYDPTALAGRDFVVLTFGEVTQARQITLGGINARLIVVGRDLEDVKGLVASRYAARPGTVYLFRPDQYVAARWRSFDERRIKAAIARACCVEGGD